MGTSKFDQLVITCTNLLYTHAGASYARDYLNHRISPTVQQKFHFGFFPPQEQLQILFTFLDKEELITNNLLYEKNLNQEHQVLFSPLEQHNLILPYRDVYGDIIALVGRTLLNENERHIANIPKYKNTSFKKSRHLFGLWEAKQAIIYNDHVYIVEGQFDCVQAHNHGIENVVALGSANMSMEQLILLLRYTKRIYILLDNDEAGEIGRSRIIETYGKYAEFTDLRVPYGFKDLDEFLSDVALDEGQELYKVLKS